MMNHTVKQAVKPPKVTTSQLTLMAVVIALRLILDYVPAINFNNFVEIGIGFVGTALSGVLFGPFYGLLVSVVNDLLGFFLTGSGIFFPGFTLSAGLAGWIYGRILWRNRLTTKRIFIAVLLVTLLINLGLNSLWIKLMYGKAWAAFMPMRIVKNVISLPLNTLILTALFNVPTVKRIIEKYRF